MTMITASVGRGGINRVHDVRTVQELLNKNRKFPLKSINVDGLIGPETIMAIEDFQRQIVKLAHSDGRVDPGGKTLQALLSGKYLTPSPPSANKFSGATWWNANQAKYPNSNKIQDLDPNFRTKAQEFLACLQTAGANVNVKSTKRSKQRAYLMHYSWKIAKGLINPSQVPNEPGVDIVWDHGDLQKSKKAAQEMVDLFGVIYQPSLNSRHIEGKAIDMDITWIGTLKIKNKTGQTIQIAAPCNGSDNTLLHNVGASYGIIKLVTDPPHWSSDGH